MAQRIRIYKPGGWDHLVLDNFECSGPKSDEIKIDVKAAGVNFADVCVRQGLYSSANEFVGMPITPGFEVAGVVSAIGKEVQGIKIGDRVLAVTFFGGYASELTVKATYVRRLPANMSFVDAAGIPAVFLTSYYAVHWLTRVHPKSVALVHSVAGGVGLSLTQVLKDLDCKVVGVIGSSHKAQVAADYGVDEIIDKSKADLWSSVKVISPSGFDLIFDPNGFSTVKQSYAHLAACGFLYVYGFQSMLSKNKGRQSLLVLARDYLRTPRFNPFDMVKRNRSVIGFNVSYLFDRLDIVEGGLTFIMDKFEDKAFRPLPVTTYAFKDVAKAHRDIESGKTTGKLILTF